MGKNPKTQAPAGAILRIESMPNLFLLPCCDLIQGVAAGVLVIIRPDHTHRPLCYRALAAIPEEELLGIAATA